MNPSPHNPAVDSGPQIFVETESTGRRLAIGLASEQVLAAPARGLLADSRNPIAGDWAANTGGRMVRLQGTFEEPAIDWINWRDGTARIVAGASIAAVSHELRRAGWALPVSGGHPYATIGSAVSSNLLTPRRGGDSDIGSYLTAIDFIDGDGIPGHLRIGNPKAVFDPAAFIGGLGLTGLIIAIEIRIEAITSAWTSVRTTRCGSFEDLLANLDEPGSSYAFASFDTTAVSSSVGQGVVINARRLGVRELPETRRHNALEYRDPAASGKRLAFGEPAATSKASKALRSLEFRTKPAAVTMLMPEFDFLHRRWTRQHPHHINYEFVVPAGQENVILTLLQELTRKESTPAAASMFRCRISERSLLHSAIDGYACSLTLDSNLDLTRLLDHADEQVAASGGYVQLGSDVRLRPEVVGQMYAGLPRWIEQRQSLDPAGRFTSDIDRRLFW